MLGEGLSFQKEITKKFSNLECHLVIFACKVTFLCFVIMQ